MARRRFHDASKVHLCIPGSDWMSVITLIRRGGDPEGAKALGARLPEGWMGRLNHEFTLLVDTDSDVVKRAIEVGARKGVRLVMEG